MKATTRARFLSVLANRENPVEFWPVRARSVAPEELVELFDRWRISGWVYKRLVENCDRVPRLIRRRTRERYAENIRDNLHRFQELEKVESAFRSQNINALIVKGMALISEIYGDPGIRPMSDIDVIVRPHQESAAVEALRDLGYNRDSLHPTVFKLGKIVLDVESEPFSIARISARDSIFSAATPHLRRRTKPLRVGGWFHAWDSSARLYSLCVHALKHGFPDGIWLVDIGETLRRMNVLDWKDATGLFRTFATEDVLMIALLRVQDFGYRLPRRAEKWLRHRPNSARVRVTRYLSSRESTSFMAESAYLAMRQKGIPSAIQSIMEAVFPNAAVYEKSPLSDYLGAFRPVYRVVQILNQAARALLTRNRF